VEVLMASKAPVVPGSIRALALPQYRRYLRRSKQKREHLRVIAADVVNILPRNIVKRCMPDAGIQAIKGLLVRKRQRRQREEAESKSRDI